MILAYMIGIVLYAILYFVGMKICLFFNPYPPDIPEDKEFEEHELCKVQISGKWYNCIKTIYILKTYGYSADHDIIEWEYQHLKYRLDNPLSETPEFIDNFCLTLNVYDSEDQIECYMAKDFKTFISMNPITSKRIYIYRKPEILRKFPVIRKSASLR